jgi:hypothetical protein
MGKRIVTGFVAVVVAVTMAIGLGGSVSAGNAGDGSDYGTQLGYEVANGNTECAGHSAFDYFGKDHNLGNDTSGHYDGGGPGANGQQTGLNNSALCGNRQGNLP